MTQTTASESSGTTLSRLDDEGRAILFTSARTASTFSDRRGDSPWFDRLPRLEYQEAVRHA